MTALRRRLRLRALPHYTTLHKFSLRIEPHALDGLVATLASFVARDGVLAVDSTGMRSGSASYYYVRTLSLRPNDAKMVDRRYRHHIKLTLAIDVGSQMVVSLLTSPGPGPDLQLLRPVVSKTVEHGPAVTAVLADRGYDSELKRRYVVVRSGQRRTYRCERSAAGHHTALASTGIARSECSTLLYTAVGRSRRR